MLVSALLLAEADAKALSTRAPSLLQGVLSSGNRRSVMVSAPVKSTSTVPENEWRAVFDRYDSDNDGALNYGQASSFFEHITPAFEANRDTAEGMLRTYDLDGDQKIDYEEAETMLKGMLRLPMPALLIKRDRYSSQSLWLSSLSNFGRSTVLQAIMQPLLGITLFALLVAVGHYYCVSAQVTKSLLRGPPPAPSPQPPRCPRLPSPSPAAHRHPRASCSTAVPPLHPVPGAPWAFGASIARGGVKMHSLLGGALSLLLVFRTNTAYGRFWEARRAPLVPARSPSRRTPCTRHAAPTLIALHVALPFLRRFQARKIWESLTNRCRELARFSFLYRDVFKARDLRAISAPHASTSLEAAHLDLPPISPTPRRRRASSSRRSCSSLFPRSSAVLLLPTCLFVEALFSS